MKVIEPPDSHFVSAALGWLGLGNVAEAKEELTRVSENQWGHPDVLEVRWCICAEERTWQEGLEIAQTLMKSAPKRATGWLHQAYALRRVPGGSVKQAWKALLPAFDKFPKEPTIAYNLSCYACQMKQLDAARVWFQRAAIIGDKEEMKKMALSDSDLEALWSEIKEM